MSVIKEFKEFAMRGNVIDLAVGVVIGGAFGKIVNSMVSDVIMPPIGMIIGGFKFNDIKITMKAAEADAAGKIIKEAVTLNIGNFIQVTFEFLIVAFAIFLVIKAMNSLKRKQEAAPAPAPPAPSNEEVLLGEIRDLLKKRG